MWLYLLAILLSTAILSWRHGRTHFVKHLLMVVAVAAGTFWGGDIFNSLLTGDPLGTGRVFYGALIGAVATSMLVTRLVPRDERWAYWNSGAIICAFDYGLLRIGCFLEGCCWGRMTDLPWAVVYTDSGAAMPFKGVPVHPVQLYDSAFGFLLAGFLLWYRDRRGGNAVLAFFALYAVGRFVTELFRGDDLRGFGPFGLSTSQWISVGVLLGVCGFLAGLKCRHPSAGADRRTHQSHPVS